MKCRFANDLRVFWLVGYTFWFWYEYAYLMDSFVPDFILSPICCSSVCSRRYNSSGGGYPGIVGGWIFCLWAARIDDNRCNTVRSSADSFAGFMLRVSYTERWIHLGLLSIPALLAELFAVYLISPSPVYDHSSHFIAPTWWRPLSSCTFVIWHVWLVRLIWVVLCVWLIWWVMSSPAILYLRWDLAFLLWRGYYRNQTKKY